MKTSKAGLEFLVREEGCVLKVYHCKPDPADVWTVGVGHVILPGDGINPGDTITHERCLELLAHDVGKCERAIANYVSVPLSQNQFDALVSLIFNIGVGGFHDSTIRAKLNGGLYNEASLHFLDWRRAGADPNFLLGRRQRERALFERPDAPRCEPWDEAYAASLVQSTLNSLLLQPDFTPHSY